MPLYPLDAVRNATIDRDLELVLEDVREDVAAFPFDPERDDGDVEDVLAVYDLARPRLNVVASLLGDLSGSQGADVGTGLGFLPVVLSRLGLRCAATELRPNMARFAAEHGIVIAPYRIGHDRAPFPPRSLDFVVFGEVLEHLKLSPVTVLRELRELVRPDGRLVLTTPNVARLEHVEALATGENFLEPFPEEIPPGSDATDFIEHVREYSIREAIEAVEGAGLAVEQVLMTGWGADGFQLRASPYSNQITVIHARR